MTAASPGLYLTPSLVLSRKLGSGAMASVWVAYHERLGSEVAVKLMSPELVENPGFIQRFAREAGAAARIRSPHVAQVFDHGMTDSGQPFIVMELLDGVDLADHLARYGPLPPVDVAALIGQVARALHRSHELGIIHRDIKPANIFLCDMGDDSVFAKLLDFGIAKAPVIAPGTATTLGRILGSPYYMSPEQLTGAADVDHRCDVWSLGTVAFEALTGQRPFEAENLAALAVVIHSREAPSLSRLRPELPPTADAWFARACCRDVTQRFQTVRDLADALNVALGIPVPRRSDMPPRPSTSAPAPPESITRNSSPPPSNAVALGERRTERRRISCIPTSIPTAGARGKLALIRNISRHGALLYTRLNCGVGERIELRLHFVEGDAGYPALAEVVRVSRDGALAGGLWRNEIAVRFVEPLDHYADQLDALAQRQARVGMSGTR